jgi:hypothetical protein
LPPQFTKKKAKCPRCNKLVDVTAALNATAYLPTLSGPTKPVAAAKSGGLPDWIPREEDPLPYPSLDPLKPPPARQIAPKPAQPAPQAPPSDDAPLSLDDDPAPPAPAPQAAPDPLRVPIQVVADSANLFLGPCDAVFIEHGLFLECIPYRPFLYAPVRSPVQQSSRRVVRFALPDARTIAIEFTGHNASRLAEDATAFLEGRRAVLDPADYPTNPPWLLALALLFALGLAIGPIALSRATALSQGTSVTAALVFGLAGLAANAAIVLATRLPVAGKVAAMTGLGVAVSVFLLFGTLAYLAGRKDAATESRSGPGSEDAAGKPPEPKLASTDNSATTAIDAAYRDGVYRFEDGPDEVTSLAVSEDSTILVIGYKNGVTRIWRFEKLTVDPSDFDLGPKSDGPPTAIQFDHTETIVYLTSSGGVTAGLWNAPPTMPVKIPGEPIAIDSAASVERFAALRGNALVLRNVPTDLIKKPVYVPPKKGPAVKSKDFLLSQPADERIPADSKGALNAPPGRLTFLAWHPTGKLLGGLADGSIVSWGAAGPGFTVVSREHKGPVRAWAASPNTWDFATGDDRGVIGLWGNKAMTPKTFIASASAAITHLSFSPTGAGLMARDADGVISVWDLAAQRAVVKARRPASKAIAYGPTDDLVLVSDGKAVELWSLRELDRRP